MTEWFDGHNHLFDSRLGDDPDGLIDRMKSAGVTRCVVNATEEADWSQVAELADRHADFIWPAFGVHPWKAHTASAGWLDRLQNLLEKFPAASVGEAGLDQWVDEPGIEIQKEVFADQLRIAREMKRPITVHCLKAWQALFEVFAEERPPDAFLMHSFGGSIELAERLLPMGAYFSFSGYFLEERKAKVVEVFRRLPTDRILVETDAPDMMPPESLITHRIGDGLNHPANLPSVAHAFAGKLEVEVELLARLTGGNARRLFGLGEEA